MNYALYDFGVTGAQTQMAKYDRDIARKEEAKALKDLALKLLDPYVKALLFENDLAKLNELKDVYHKMYQAQKDLFIAGEVNKVTLADSAIKVIDTDQKIKQLEHQRIKSLLALSMLSHKKFDPKNVKLLPLSTEKKHQLNYEHSIEHQKLQLQIRKKQEEISANNGSLVPKINLYSRYNYYGSDTEHFDKALNSVDPSGYSVGFSISWTLFEGFAYNRKSQRLYLELEKVKLQDRQAKEKFEQEITSLNRDIYNFHTQSVSQKDSVNKQEEKSDLVYLYREQALVDTSFSLQVKADTIEKSYEQKKLLIEKDAALKKLDYLNPENLYKEYR
jgi:outer membrane protein TolC